MRWQNLFWPFFFVIIALSQDYFNYNQLLTKQKWMCHFISQRNLRTNDSEILRAI